MSEKRDEWSYFPDEQIPVFDISSIFLILDG